jgi:hypothetical protein
MAKGLPYFKFTPSEWLTGEICFEDLETQGLFINICAWYWQRDGNLTVQDITKRYNKPTAFNSLSIRFLNIENEHIKIAFLDEQLMERNHVSKVNSKNGSKGGRPKTKEEKPTAFNSLSETKANENPIRKEEEKEQEKKEENNKKIIYPSEQEFFDYARTLKTYSSNLEFAIQSKFLAWSENNWIDGNGKKIKNWKSTLINSIPYMKPQESKPKGKITELMEQYNRFNNG